MPITSAQIQSVTASLYERSLKKFHEDTKVVLRRAQGSATSATARKTLTIMLQSADAAEERDHQVCSDVGTPVYAIKVGTRAARIEGSVRQAIVAGFAELAAHIQPPILRM